MREEILKLHEQGLSYREIANRINKSKSLVAFYIRTKDKNWDDKKKEKELKDKEFHDLVISIIKESNNFNQVCNKLNLRPTNENYNRIKKIINLYNVDISHFNTLDTPVKSLKRYTRNEIFCKDSVVSKNVVVKNLHLLREHKCEKCQRTTWSIDGKLQPIPLQVHHINGNRTDNRLENLQLLCPNCHYFTDNFAGKNIKKIKKETKICPNCGQTFIPASTKQIYCSKKCIPTKTKIVPKEELEDKLQTMSISQIAKIYNVSPKTIRSWCKKYNIVWKHTQTKYCSICGKPIKYIENRHFCSVKCYEINNYNIFQDRTKHIDLSNKIKPQTLDSLAKEFNVTKYHMYKYLVINNYKHLLQKNYKSLEHLDNYVKYWKELDII